jgi:hypothetical protein
MAYAISKRRGQGEDSIYWDESKNRYVGAVSLGFSPAGTRIRKKVIGRTKTEVRDKLRELHKQVESGLQPKRGYTVADALEDWLAVGLDGLSARTVTLYRDTIAKALSEKLGMVRLNDVTVADVQKALTAMATRLSTGRPQPDGHDGTGLPAPDRSCTDPRRRGHGRDLRLTSARSAPGTPRGAVPWSSLSRSQPDHWSRAAHGESAEESGGLNRSGCLRRRQESRADVSFCRSW